MNINNFFFCGLPHASSSSFLHRHRGSQAVNLADELRSIALSQATASSALADTGRQLVVDALAEQPLPREYVRPCREIDNATAETNATRMRVDRNSNPSDNTLAKSVLQTGVSGPNGNDTSLTGSGGNTESYDIPAIVAVSAVAAHGAIEIAAGKEETAAAARIQSFLRRRRQERVVAASEAERAVAAAASDPTVEGGGGWLGAAIRVLRQAVDLFILGEELQQADSVEHSVTSKPSSAPWDCLAGNEEQENTSQDNAHAYNSGTNRTTSDTTKNHHSDSDNDEHDYLPVFPPVPLRARAPSLYTLPPPGLMRRIHNASGAGGSTNNISCGDIRSGVFTKLDPAVAARLSSARSVFGLCATDILTAFSPPPPPSGVVSSATEALSRPRTVPGTPGHDGYRLTLSPDALRLRLRTEAKEALHAGLGRPWGSRWRLSGAIIGRQRSAFRKNTRTYDADGGGGGAQHKRRRTEFVRPMTALGRRLLAKRLNAARAARRRRIIGATDAFRARLVGRQLRSGAAASALEGVGRTLDDRIRIAREMRVSPAHVEQLLDILDRFVFSESQVTLPITART